MQPLVLELLHVLEVALVCTQILLAAPPGLHTHGAALRCDCLIPLKRVLAEIIAALTVDDKEAVLGSEPRCCGRHGGLPLTEMTPCRWVYEQLWGKDAEWRHVRSLVENGIMEVDGPPPDGRSRWSRYDLVEEITELEGHRFACVWLQGPVLGALCRTLCARMCPDITVGICMRYVYSGTGRAQERPAIIC